MRRSAIQTPRFGREHSRKSPVGAKRCQAAAGIVSCRPRFEDREMEFGIFSNGFRPHTTAAQTYEEDLAEIVLADQLGFRDAYISEHHGEPIYINKVDTLPGPEPL